MDDRAHRSRRRDLGVCSGAVDALHLVGPPLDLWLGRVTAGAQVGVAFVGPRRGLVGRRVRGFVAALAPVDVEAAARRSLDVCVVITTLERGEIAPVIDRVRPGGRLIELAYPTGLFRRRRAHRQAAGARLTAWLRAGLYEPARWIPVDLRRVLVTSGRARG